MAAASREYPILEYDPAIPAVIEPARVNPAVESMPEGCVLCFFQDVLAEVCEKGGLPRISHLVSEIGRVPIYTLEHAGRRIAVAHPGVGGPLSGTFLEELIAKGCRQFIACGGAGVLKPDIVVGHVVVPDTALRDEGTSYHYLPPAREVAASPRGVAAIRRVLERREVPYVQGKTWTTDAPYRETPEKIARRRAEGCVTVEMEAASFFAIAQFRGVDFAQILYGGDDVSGAEWDQRDWHLRASVREKVFWLAVESAVEMGQS